MSELTQISLGIVIGTGLLVAFLIWIAIQDGRKPPSDDKKKR